MSAREMIGGINWYRIGERFGFPSALCAAMLLMLYSLFAPLIDVEIETSQKVREEITKQTTAVLILAQSVERQERMHGDDRRTLEDLARRLDKLWAGPASRPGG
ncbi:MAG: hypothetical protein PHU85_00005 [Phycisphaerae bacterium]|nr:hypothetical protein [Phycisphaerae bacterium]